MTGSIHEWDGAYVLGALEPAERRRYEEHLVECSACSRSVRELAGLPGILGRLDQEEALALRDLPDEGGLREDAHVAERTAGVAARIRRHRGRMRATGALVLVAVLALGSVGGWSIVRALQPVPQQAAIERPLAPVGGSRLTASLRVTPVGWGTRFDWSCAYGAAAAHHDDAYAPTSYSLVVHTRGGDTSTVATWSSDAGEADGLVASSAIPADTIRSVDIRVTGSPEPLATARF